MKKIIFLIVVSVYFFLSGRIFASSAKAVVETQVEGGEVKVYQSVETTVNGETIKKESNQPGKLELEMKKAGEGKPTVIFTQESNSSSIPSPEKGVSPIKKESRTPNYFWFKIANFFQNIWLNLTKRLKK
jgi:hypothetical protein